MRAKIASHITISAKLLVGAAVLNRPTTPTTTNLRAGVPRKPLVLRYRHDPRPDHGDLDDFSNGPRVGAARQDLGLLLGHAAHVRPPRRIRLSRQYCRSINCSCRGCAGGHRLHRDSLVAPRQRPLRQVGVLLAHVLRAVEDIPRPRLHFAETLFHGRTSFAQYASAARSLQNVYDPREWSRF